MNRFLILLGALLMLFAFGPAPTTLAQDEPDVEAEVDEPATDVRYRGWGPHAGGTFDPDQFHVGVHLNMGTFAERGFIRPNAELGFGSDITMFSATLDLAYRFETDWDEWSPYVGAGPGLFISSVDVDNGLSTDTEVDFGVNVLGGVEKSLANGNRFYVEGKVGFSNAPDFKVALGWTFFQ